jgi:hypothetical protein
MAPAWGPVMVSVVGPVGLLLVLLAGRCGAEGKTGGWVSACVSVCPA